MRAAISPSAHYLDIAAEFDSYLLAERLDREARAARVMLLHGSGGSVAMLGCVASHAVAHVDRPRTIRIALHVKVAMSRGSSISATENVRTETLARRDGQLQGRSSSEARSSDFGMGYADCFPLTLPDLIAIGRTTGVPNVEAYVNLFGDAFPQGNLRALHADDHRLAGQQTAKVGNWREPLAAFAQALPRCDDFIRCRCHCGAAHRA